MNIETKQLENHSLRMSVAIEADRMEKAKRNAARKISKRVNIPGFRKGKAPYNMIARFVGEAAIIEEAMDDMVQDIYRDALAEADIDPYGPGQMEEPEFGETTRFIFTVPLRPEVDLGDYRTVRKDFEEPVVEDKDIDDVIDELLEQEALVDESQQPAKVNDLVTMDVHSFFTDGESGIADHDDADEVDPHEDERESYFHQHDLSLRLREGDSEPVAPGFTAAMVGGEVGETRRFELTLPHEEDVKEELRGRTIEVIAQVKKVETMTLPALNDDFAARVTDRFANRDEIDAARAAHEAAQDALDDADKSDDDDAWKTFLTPLTLLQLRMRVRESLTENAIKTAHDTYVGEILDEMIEKATVRYHPVMVDEQIDDMLGQLEENLSQQGISMDIYTAVTGKSQEDLREDYRSRAEELVVRSLVLSEIVSQEFIRVTDDDFEAHVQRMMKDFDPGMEEMLRSTLNNPSIRNNVLNNIAQDKTFERIRQIGMGEAPSLEEIQAAQETATDGDNSAEEVTNIEESAADEPDDAQTSEGESAPEVTESTTEVGDDR